MSRKNKVKTNKRIPYKRRKLQLTNYKKRAKLILSGSPRIVVRISNKYVTCQFIKYSSNGDSTVYGFNSSKLESYGFKPGKNLRASYLTGMIAGLNALKAGIKNAVLDTGLKPSVKNSRIYACLKGAIEAGIKIPNDSSVLPSDELLKKNTLTDVIKKIKGENK